MRVTPQAQAWQRLDPDSVVDVQGGINHRQSMREDARTICEEALHAAIPLDRSVMLIAKWVVPGKDLSPMNRTLWLAFVSWWAWGPALLLGLLYDIAELVTLPFTLAWKTVDIVANAAAKDADLPPAPGAVRRFDFSDDAFLVRLMGETRHGAPVTTQAAMARPRGGDMM